MKNRVRLLFKPSLTNLAGYDFGLDVYNEQVKGKIDIKEEFEIEFPEQIKVVAYSFVQGFFKQIVSEIGLAETENRLRIIAKNDLENVIKRKLI